MLATQNALRQELLDTATLRRLSLPTNGAGSLQVASHLAALLLSGTWLWQTWGTWWAVPAFVVHGTLINFLYAGQHELSHWTVFRTRALNELFGRLFGFVLIYPRDFDQIQHFAHHRYTQDWGATANSSGPLHARPPTCSGCSARPIGTRAGAASCASRSAS